MSEESSEDLDPDTKSESFYSNFLVVSLFEIQSQLLQLFSRTLLNCSVDDDTTLVLSSVRDDGKSGELIL